MRLVDNVRRAMLVPMIDSMRLLARMRKLPRDLWVRVAFRQGVVPDE